MLKFGAYGNPFTAEELEETFDLSKEIRKLPLLQQLCAQLGFTLSPAAIRRLQAEPALLESAAPIKNDDFLDVEARAELLRPLLSRQSRRWWKLRKKSCKHAAKEKAMRASRHCCAPLPLLRAPSNRRQQQLLQLQPLR
jgi:hypothetical protein